MKGKEGGLMVEQDFAGNLFTGQHYMVFRCFFSFGFRDWTMNILVYTFWKISILWDPGAISWVEKNGGESFQERVRRPLGCYC